MARTFIIRPSFNAGVVSPKLDARADLQKGAVALRTCRNLLIESYGRAVRRPGLRFIAQTAVAVPYATPTPTPTPSPSPSPSPSQSSLLTDLVEWWELDEASGNRAGSHASLTLTDTNTVTSASGLNSGETAAQFTSANSEQLTRASETALQTGDIDCTFAVWVYPTAIDATGKDVMCKSTSGAFEWFLELYDSGGYRVRFRFGAGDVDNVEAGLTLNAWHLIVAWHDSVANTMNYELNNNGTIRSVSNSAGTTTNTNPFRIGGPLTGSRYFDGRIAKAGFWKRVLTDSERDSLYNSGTGVSYPFS